MSPVYFYTRNSLFFIIKQIFVKRLQPIRQRITPHRICTRHFYFCHTFRHILDAQLWNNLPQLGFNLAYRCRKRYPWVWKCGSVLRSLLICGNATIRYKTYTPFLVSTTFSHRIVGSVCKTSLFHCYLDQKQACSRPSPFGLLIPEPFHSGSLKGHDRQICKNIQFPLSFIIHFATVGCCVEIIGS